MKEYVFVTYIWLDSYKAETLGPNIVGSPNKSCFDLIAIIFLMNEQSKTQRFHHLKYMRIKNQSYLLSIAGL